jgi:long-chain acyl-CoA synthetase
MIGFYHRFSECAERWPDNVALEIQRPDGIESCTYGELRHRAESVARWLVEKGFPRGARAAIVAANDPRWVACYLGVVAAGGVTVPLDTALRADELRKLLDDSGSILVFTDHKHRAAIEAATVDGRQEIVLLDCAQAAAPASPLSPPPLCLDNIFRLGPGSFAAQPVEAGDLASVLYTSGTTADPKGVMLTHGNLEGEIEAVFSWAEVGCRDGLLGVLPLFHVLSQMANLLLPLVKGARVVYLETLNTTELLRALRERPITAFAVVPQFFYLIHERIFQEVAKRSLLSRSAVRVLMAITRGARALGWNPGKLFFRRIHAIFGPNMRYLITGGARFDPKIGADFAALGIDILQAYGLTETTAAITATDPRRNRIGSVGKALRGVELRISNLHPQTDPGPAIGEVEVRGAVVMKGYWNRPDATAEVIRDGWFRTGDLGYLDASAHLYLVGRDKEVIILSNGKNIYPEEIEAHYGKSPYIKELCVMGLEQEEGVAQSERMHAVVVPNFDVLRQRKIVNIKEVLRFDIETLSSQLPSTKRIGSYELWQKDLPRTTTRKLKRFAIEKQVREARRSAPAPDIPASVLARLSAEDAAWFAEPEVARAVSIIRSAARTSPPLLAPASNLELDLGLDSMRRVELLVELEQAFGAKVDESRLSEIYSVRDLVELVRRSASEPGAADSSSSSSSYASSTAGWQRVLQAAPSDPEVLRLRHARGFPGYLIFLLTRLVRLLSYTLFRLRVEGLENLPARAPYILSSNHQSYVDAIVLSSLLRWSVFRNLFAVGTSEIFGSGVMRTIARWLRVVLVDPDANLIPALRASAFGLRNGRILILYPEGERTIDGTPKAFKKGAAILASVAQVPIVPVAISGFYQAWPRGKSFPRLAALKIKIGQPLLPPESVSAGEAEWEAFGSALRARVVEMWQELQNSPQ